MTTEHLAVFETNEHVSVGKVRSVKGLRRVQVVTSEGSRLVTTWASADDFKAGRRDFENRVEPGPQLTWEGPASLRLQRGRKLRHVWPVVAWLIALVAGLDAYVYRYLELFGVPEVVLHDRPLGDIDLLEGKPGHLPIGFMNVGRVPIRLEVQNAIAGLGLVPEDWQLHARRLIPTLPVGGARQIQIPVNPRQAGATQLRVTGQVEGGALRSPAAFEEVLAVRVWKPVLVRRGSASRISEHKGDCAFTLEVGVQADTGHVLSAVIEKRPEVAKMRVSGKSVVPDSIVPAKNLDRPGDEFVTVDWRTTALHAFTEHPFNIHLDTDEPIDDWEAICSKVKVTL